MKILLVPPKYEIFLRDIQNVPILQQLYLFVSILKAIAKSNSNLRYRLYRQEREITNNKMGKEGYQQRNYTKNEALSIKNDKLKGAIEKNNNNWITPYLFRIFADYQWNRIIV